MINKIFTSRTGWFTLALPTDWEEYDDNDTEDTYAFFNSKKWAGNFRITPFRWTDVVDPDEDKAGEFIAEELQENKIATKIKLGDFNCAYYKEDLLQEGNDQVIYYWMAGKKDNLFVCSFTINKDQEHTDYTKAEINIVQDIIKSIQIK